MNCNVILLRSEDLSTPLSLRPTPRIPRAEAERAANGGGIVLSVRAGMYSVRLCRALRKPAGPGWDAVERKHECLDRREVAAALS